MSAPAKSPVRTTLVCEEGFRFRVRFDQAGVPDLITDEPPPLGKGEGPNPERLLAAAVGNCLAASLLFCLQKAHLPVQGLEATVDLATVRNEEGRLRVGSIAVRLAPRVGADVRDKMGRCVELFESFCVVTESVRRGIDVEVRVEPQVAG